MRRLPLLLSSLIVLTFALPASGQVPNTFSYQGVLTLADGSLVPDGAYDLTFRLYWNEAGGIAVHTENHPAVAVERGGFSVVLGVVAPLAVAFDRQLWLGVQVGADPEMAPRIRLTSSPYALNVRFPLFHEMSSDAPALYVSNTGGGPAAQFEDQLYITGAFSSTYFNMGASGDASVGLPASSIGSGEIIDEPGVASATSNAVQVMDGTTQNLLTRSIDVPATGYCLVIGTLEAQAIHTAGTQDGANFGVSDQSGTFQPNQDHLWQIPSGAASGNYTAPITVHGLFSVSAGLNTFYMVGDEATGSVQWNEGQLTIVYFRTAYGTVTPTLTTGSGDEMALRGTLRGAADEKREAEAFHLSRLQREMAATQAEVEELKRQLRQVVVEQTAAKDR